MATFGKKQTTYQRQSQRTVRPQSALSPQAEAFASQLGQSNSAAIPRSNDFTLQSPGMSVASDNYAGFLQRVGSYIVDTIAVTLPFLVIFGGAIVERLGNVPAAAVATGTADAYILIAIGDYLLLYLGLTALYYTLQEASGAQATLGKRVFGIMLTSKHGERPGFGSLLLRNTLGRFLINISPFYIGFLMCLSTQRKQCLHDKMGGVIVVRKGTQDLDYDSVFA